MFAVIKTGGKQYKVAPNDILRIEKIEGAPGDTVKLESVLMLGTEDDLTLGAPLVEGAMVTAEVVEQTRAGKIIVFKKKRRKNHRRRNGHRQFQTVLRVTEILAAGGKPSKGKAVKTTEGEAPTPKAATPKAAAPKAPAKRAPVKKAAAKKTVTKKE